MGSNELDKASSEQAEQLKQALLANLAKSGNVTKSCKATAVGRTTYYDWCNNDPIFAEQATKALHLARESRMDKLEDSIMDQALGVWCDETQQWLQRPNVIAQIFSLKALSRQSSNPDRIWSDAPPPEPKAIEDTAKRVDQTSTALAELMQEFVNSSIKTDQKAKAIDAETQE